MLALFTPAVPTAVITSSSNFTEPLIAVTDGNGTKFFATLQAGDALTSRPAETAPSTTEIIITRKGGQIEPIMCVPSKLAPHCLQATSSALIGVKGPRRGVMLPLLIAIGVAFGINAIFKQLSGTPAPDLIAPANAGPATLNPPPMIASPQLSAPATAPTRDVSTALRLEDAQCPM
jgi:hypothetical protein